MDKFDAVTSYTQKLLDGYENKSDANGSEQSVGSTMRSTIAVQDMFGNQEVAKFNPNPVKGKKYLAFTVLMVIILSFVVIKNAHTTSLSQIVSEKIKQDQTVIDFKPKEGSTTTKDDTTI